MKSLPAGNDMSQFGLETKEDIYTKKIDWMSVIKGWMDMQYNAGNMRWQSSKVTAWTFQESGAALTDRWAAERRKMQINNSVSDKYYTPYKTNTSVKAISGFSLNTDGKVEVQEADENWQGFAEFVDYQEFHKAWMSQGATTAFSYTNNKGFNAEESTSIAPAMSSLIKVANGQIPLNMFHSSRTQNNSEYAKKGLEAFGIDTSRTFIINEKAFHFDSDGQIRLGEKTDEQIDFSRFAPNAPEEVRQAFIEASEETGYSEFGQMDHISQMLVTQVENRYNGKSNSQDVFGGSVASALQAARQILYDLENPLVPVSQRGENAAKYVEQEKEFYQKFIEKLEALTDESGVTANQEEDYLKFLQEKINEIFVKIQNGDTETSYQIGSQSFTEEEWDTFLENFDSIEEVIQELMKEEQSRKEETTVEEMKQDSVDLLTAESTSCTYPTADPEDEDIRYITYYSLDGIHCKKAGETEDEWFVVFESEEQYEKVMNFIDQFPSDWNMRFAAHENFWTDFLNDEIDIDGFMDFMEGTNKGVPDYSITVGDSMYVDKEKAQWAEYLNPLGSRFYTAEEMNQRQMELMAANVANKTKIADSYEEMYKRSHPEYNGEKIFCEYPGGSLSPAVEMTESKGTGDVLGLTMLPYSDTISYGMSAFYSEKSTEADPVIRINSNYGGENRYFDVHVNEVDPRNASQLEMFALSCYMDDQGITDGGSLGSYTRMKAYAGNDAYLGQGLDLQSAENVDLQIDWVSMLKRMAEEYLQNTQTYSQYLDCGKLAAALEKWTYSF